MSRPLAVWEVVAMMLFLWMGIVGVFWFLLVVLVDGMAL